MNPWQHAHPEVVLLPAKADAGPPVLGQPLLGDIQRAHDLQPGNYCHLELPHRRGQGHVLEQAVHAVPHAVLPVEGFEVDVGGTRLDRPAEDPVHEVDHRRLVGRPLVRQVGGTRRKTPFLSLALHHEPLDGLRPEPVAALQEPLNLRRGHEHPHEVAAEELRKLIPATPVEGIARAQVQCPVLLAQRHHRVLEGEGGGHQRPHRLVRNDLARLQHLVTQLFP